MVVDKYAEFIALLFPKRDQRHLFAHGVPAEGGQSEQHPFGYVFKRTAPRPGGIFAAIVRIDRLIDPIPREATVEGPIPLQGIAVDRGKIRPRQLHPDAILHRQALDPLVEDNERITAHHLDIEPISRIVSESVGHGILCKQRTALHLGNIYGTDPGPL